MVHFSGIPKMDKVIRLDDGQKVTPKQVLSCVRTSTNYDCSLFTQINFIRRENCWVGICDNNEFREAKHLAKNIVPILIEKFGDKARK